MNKKFMLSGLFAASILAVVGVVAFAQTPTSAALFADTPSGEWHHYKKQDPTSTKKGIREYWVECGGGYQFAAPATGTIIDEEGAPDTSEFKVDDDRYFSYQFDEDNLGFDYYNYGCRMYNTASSDYKDWRATYEHDACKFNLYSDGGTKILWRIELPRINYQRYPTVTMNVLAPNWYEGNNMGPEADQLTYHTNFGGNKAEGKIKLTLKSTGLHMEFNSLEYASQLAFENTFTDSNIITGLAPAYFYTEDLYDRYLNISDVQLSTAVTPEDIYSYAADTTKISVENGDIKLIGSTDYSIISNGYATNETGLLIEGNANPGAAVITLPAINFNLYTVTGSVSFKFGVRNNSEPMYFGSGDSKVALGKNSPTSQDDNNNGYVNWEMVISSSGAYVKNVYQNQTYAVTLTQAMLAGTERMKISGGGTSIYRRYLVTDFYWNV